MPKFDDFDEIIWKSDAWRFQPAVPLTETNAFLKSTGGPTGRLAGLTFMSIYWACGCNPGRF